MDHTYIENSVRETVVLNSDPATCVGCRGFNSNISICRELRQADTCQKKLSAHAHLLDVVVQLVGLACTRHREQQIGDIINALLAGRARITE